MVRIQISVPLPRWVYNPARRLKRAVFASDYNSVNLWGDRDVEWSFIASQMPCGPGEALDFGCDGSYLSVIAARRGFRVLALDLEPQAFYWRHPDVRFVQGDLLKLDLPLAYFDLIINCSSVEHVGLVGRYSVTEQRVDGDLEAMARMHELMKPGAMMLLTVPVGRDTVFAPLCSVYGSRRLPKLLTDFQVEWEEFWRKGPDNLWSLCDRALALEFEASAGSWDPGQNVYALGCFVLRRPE